MSDLLDNFQQKARDHARTPMQVCTFSVLLPPTHTSIKPHVQNDIAVLCLEFIWIAPLPFRLVGQLSQWGFHHGHPLDARQR